MQNCAVRPCPAINKNRAGAYTVSVKRILFTGGGSAGHVIPNLAVMQELKGSYELAYMGTDGIERGLLSPFGCPYFLVNCPKLVRSLTPKNLTIPFRLISAERKALGMMEQSRPDLVFSKGGYASFPAVWAAQKLGIPVLTHESDLSPGLCTRMVAKKCRYVLTSFPETAKRFPNGRCVGSPIRRSLLSRNKSEALAKYGFGTRPVLLVLGGGSGSRALNAAVRDSLNTLLIRFDILHLCGKGNVMPNAPRGYVQREFERDMASAYACADLVLSRAGSNTVFELLTLGKPALLVPLEHASRGDQAENARYFAEKGLCAVLREQELDDLPSALLCLYGNASMRTSLKCYSSQNGTDAIIGVIREVIG